MMSNPNGGKLVRRFSSSYRKLLHRVAFRILSDINDGAAEVCGALLDDWTNGNYADGFPHVW